MGFHRKRPRSTFGGARAGSSLGEGSEGSGTSVGNVAKSAGGKEELKGEGERGKGAPGSGHWRPRSRRSAAAFSAFVLVLSVTLKGTSWETGDPQKVQETPNITQVPQTEAIFDQRIEESPMSR